MTTTTDLTISTSFKKMDLSNEKKKSPVPLEIKKFKPEKKDEEEKEKHILLELWLYAKNRAWQKKLLTVVVTIISGLVILDFWMFGYIKEGLRIFLAWMKEEPSLGFVSFICLFAFAIVIFIPPAILVIMSSFVFVNEYGQYIGMTLTFIASFLGAAIGAVISFLRSSYMMRDLVKLFSKRYKIIRAADSALKRNGFRVMLLLRLNSLIPFSALNYIGGVTGVTLTDFTLSLVGIIPEFIVYVIIGGAAQGTLFAFNTSINEVQYILLVIGLVAAIFALFSIIHLAHLELDKEIDAEKTTPLPDCDEEEGVEILHYDKGIDDEEWFWFWV